MLCRRPYSILWKIVTMTVKHGLGHWLWEASSRLLKWEFFFWSKVLYMHCHTGAVLMLELDVEWRIFVLKISRVFNLSLSFSCFGVDPKQNCPAMPLGFTRLTWSIENSIRRAWPTFRHFRRQSWSPIRHIVPVVQRRLLGKKRQWKPRMQMRMTVWRIDCMQDGGHACWTAVSHHVLLS